MPSEPRPRKTFSLSDSLNRQLNTYAQVAAAAGVSVLALTAASEAEVIYTEAHQVTQSNLYIDLNHDGIEDFILRPMYYAGSSGLEVGLNAYGIAGNRVAGQRLQTSSGYFFSGASALHRGAKIGPKGKFSVRFPLMAMEIFARVGSAYSDLGPWVHKNKGKGVSNRYLGFKFLVDGQVHYGWARLSVTLGHHPQYEDVSATLTGYAYETIPNKPIVAGRTTGRDVITVSPGSLGSLALGRK